MKEQERGRDDRVEDLDLPDSESELVKGGQKKVTKKTAPLLDTSGVAGESTDSKHPPEIE